MTEDDVRDVLVALLNQEIPVTHGHEDWSYHDALLDVASELGIGL